MLPLPPAHDVAAAERFVADHLGGLVADEVGASPRFRGGQAAADAALAALDVTGYAARRNEVWPTERRGATAVAPYVRHGLLTLQELWDAVADAPPKDRSKYRDELLWQEYARHLYARLGTATGQGLRHALAPGHVQPTTADPAGRPPVPADAPGPVTTEPWDRTMACLDVTVSELERDGYLVNQTRMWLASHWAVRERADWRAGEDRFFRHLLDGSRAANRAGWQWTVGAATGKPYGFSRWQVTKRAPGLCATCPLEHACPIEDWPEDPPLGATEPDPRLSHDPDPTATAGPADVEVRADHAGRTAPRSADDPTDRADHAAPADPELVWLTAESLGDGDPALAAHPDLPVAFVFDAPLLQRLQLSAKRLVFLTETLAELAEHRAVTVHLGDPTEVLRGRRLAVTHAPVPGFRRRAAALEVVARHPWPWLRRPHAGSVASFSAWRRTLERSPASGRVRQR
jgi:deoxyribodipyrimidine photo-lyase